MENDDPNSVFRIQYVSAHEFGHIFGIDDAYDYKGIPNAVNIAPTDDLMRKHTGSTSAYDIRLMLSAYQTGKFQYWPAP